MTNTAHLDTQSLIPYLRDVLPALGAQVAVQKFSGGQSNPTFLLDDGQQKFVLRRQPPGELLKSAHAVDREFRVMSALADTDVPVPAVFHLCEDKNVIGSMFYIMEHVEGRIFWDSALPEIDDADTRKMMYTDMCRVLAALHDVDVSKAGLTDYGKPGNYFARQVGRWSKQYLLSELDPIPAMHEVMAWLEQHVPEDDGQVSLVHGDYRLDNVMFAPDKPQINAVLDWELSTLGHPLADLAYQCMNLRLPSNIGHAPGLGGVDRQALGIPGEQEYIDMYCQYRGISGVSHWSFYLAFSFFRLAAIAQGVAKRAAQGNASSKRAVEVGKMVAPLATMAAETIANQ